MVDDPHNPLALVCRSFDRLLVIAKKKNRESGNGKKI